VYIRELRSLLVLYAINMLFILSTGYDARISAGT
jgi:hypothetical protein